MSSDEFQVCLDKFKFHCDSILILYQYICIASYVMIWIQERKVQTWIGCKACRKRALFATYGPLRQQVALNPQKLQNLASLSGYS